jgi:hypothetical protein
MKSASLATLSLCALALSACESATAGEGGDVRIRMGARTSTAAVEGGPLVVPGDNGELTITDLRVVVAEFELKGDDDLNPCAAAGGADDCEDFDAGPMFVDLPLAGEVTVSAGAVPPGSYREIDFEVEDLDDDEEEPAEAERIRVLLQQIRAEFADWPEDASILVVGSFRPRSGGVLGAPVQFRVFLEAEIEVEIEPDAAAGGGRCSPAGDGDAGPRDAVPHGNPGGRSLPVQRQAGGVGDRPRLPRRPFRPRLTVSRFRRPPGPRWRRAPAQGAAPCVPRRSRRRPGCRCPPPRPRSARC